MQGKKGLRMLFPADCALCLQRFLEQGFGLRVFALIRIEHRKVASRESNLKLVLGSVRNFTKLQIDRLGFGELSLIFIKKRQTPHDGKRCPILLASGHAQAFQSLSEFRLRPSNVASAEMHIAEFGECPERV